MLIDSHCHLDRLDLSRADNSLDNVINAAQTAGVERMLCVCISQENKQAVLGIANNYEGIFASAGVHPCDVSEKVVSADELETWIAQKVVALGETGLDYHYTTEFKDQQHESFANHLIAAGKHQLPVIVHTREAREDTIQLIKEYGNHDSAGVLHCFTESWEMARQAMELNYMISISGIVTFKNAIELKDVVRRIPLDHLLVETDSPYLAPIPYRGKPNFPAYVKEVAEYVAQLKGISYEALCEKTAENFFKLFSKAY